MECRAAHRGTVCLVSANVRLILTFVTSRPPDSRLLGSSEKYWTAPILKASKNLRLRHSVN